MPVIVQTVEAVEAVEAAPPPTAPRPAADAAPPGLLQRPEARQRREQVRHARLRAH